MIVLTVLLTMTFSIALSACDKINAFLYGEEKKEEEKKEDEECEHNWVLTTGGIKPTCLAAGSEVYVCTKCGQEKRNDLPAVEHNYINKRCQYCGRLAPADKAYQNGGITVSAYNMGTGDNPSYTVLIDGKGTIKDNWLNDSNWKGVFSKIKIVNINGTDIGLPANSFAGDTMLTEVTISGSLATVGASAFEGCSRLKEIVIPEGIVTIGEKAFFGCEQLNDVFIGKTLTKIGKNAFGGCSRLKNITLPFAGCNERQGADSAFGSLFDKGTSSSCSQVYGGENSATAAYYSIPESLKTVTLNGSGAILSYSFADCSSSIDKLTLSADIKKIEKYAFCNNSGLKKVVFEENSTLTEIGEHAFDSCTSLDSFRLPVGVKTLNVSVFCRCRNMATFEFESGSLLESIKAEAFLNCSSLALVILPEEVTAIETNGFKGCTSLSEIRFGSKVDTLGINSFADCSLTNVYINSAAVANSANDNAARLFGAGSGFGLWIEESIEIDGRSYLYEHYTCPNANYLTEKDGKKYVYWEIK